MALFKQNELIKQLKNSYKVSKGFKSGTSLKDTLKKKLFKTGVQPLSKKVSGMTPVASFKGVQKSVSLANQGRIDKLVKSVVLNSKKNYNNHSIQQDGVI